MTDSLHPPPTHHHHHQTPAAGSLPHFTPSSTRRARVITGAHRRAWPPHLPPSLVGPSHLGPYDEAFPGVGSGGGGAGGGFSYFTLQFQGVVKSEGWGELSDVSDLSQIMMSMVLLQISPRARVTVCQSSLCTHVTDSHHVPIGLVISGV